MGRELSLEGKLNQTSVRERVREKFTGGRPVGPWVIELDPTTACNLACHDCISANLLNQGGFERERIKELAREFHAIGVRAVVLIGGGEPMAHPEFGTITSYFHDQGIHVGVTSNGTLIERYMDVLADKTKWVRISVDAGTEEVFKTYRPAPNGASVFPTVVRGMRELGKRKKGLLGYSFLVLSMRDDEGRMTGTNATDIAAAAKLAKDLGCDYFEVKPSFDMMHFLIDHTSTVKDLVNAQVDSVRHLEDASFKIISPFTLGDALDGTTTQPKTYTRCLTAELRTVVSPSGVYVCPYHRGNMNMRLGDANKHSLQDIWGGGRRKIIMDKVNPSIHCTFHCIRHGSNQLLEKWAAEGVPEGGVDDYDFFI